MNEEWSEVKDLTQSKERDEAHAKARRDFESRPANDPAAGYPFDVGFISGWNAHEAEHQNFLNDTGERLQMIGEGVERIFGDVSQLAERKLDLEDHFANPIDMILWCPECGEDHVDAPSNTCENCGHDQYLHKNNECMNCRCKNLVVWTNPPHKSHRCSACNTVWRPADVSTNGVAEIKTRGENDTWPEVANG